MANPHPNARPENLRSPWQPGTSGNPAGYSHDRRISDAIEGFIVENGLDSMFTATAVAKALGLKNLLKQEVIDPETGQKSWVELKPDLGWYKLIYDRLEPVTKKTKSQAHADAVARLRAMLATGDDDDFPPGFDRSVFAECPGQSPSAGARQEPGPPENQTVTGQVRSPSDRGDCAEKSASAGALLRDVPAREGSGQAALKVSQPLPGAGDPALTLTLAVEPLSDQCREPIQRGLLELLSPVRHAASFLAAQLAGLCTGDIRIRPGLAGGPGRALAEIAVVACFLLVHQAVVVDHQRAGGQVVPAGAVAADEQRLEPLRGLDVQVMSRLVPDRPARDLAAAEQVGAHPSTLLTRPAFPVLFPVLAPEKPPDGEPPPGVGL